MEAVRPTQLARAEPASDVVDDRMEELPPPPAPFPVELLSNLDTVRPDLSSLQSSCISTLTSLLPPSSSLETVQLARDDQQLAATLTELLEVSYELETFRPPEYTQANGEHEPPTSETSAAMNRSDSFAVLESHLADLQASSSRQSRRTDGFHPAINVVREELAWNRVETLTRAVLQLVQARSDLPSAEPRGASAQDKELGPIDDPPSYSPTADADSRDHELPSYTGNEHNEGIKEKPSIAEAALSRETTRVSSAPSEKMMHELEAVTTAIERLQSVAPRFQDQRVSMRLPSSFSMAGRPERAQEDQGGSTKSQRALEKQKMKELEEIWDRIERAHGKRKARDDEQRVDMDGIEESRAMQRERFLQSLYDQAAASRMQGQDGSLRAVDKELARARDLRDRDHFLKDLIDQSADGRLNDQDSNEPRHDGSFLLNLLSSADGSRLSSQDYPAPPHRQNGDLHDPREIVTMRDFFATSKPPSANGNPKQNTSTMVGSDSESGGEKEGKLSKLKGMMKRRSTGALAILNGTDTDLSSAGYICEHQEQIGSIDIRVQAVLPPKDPLVLEECLGDSRTAIMFTSASSSRIRLPCPAEPFSPIPLVGQDGYLRAKLRSAPSTSTAATPFHRSPLPASELRSMRPTSLRCGNCDRAFASFPPTPKTRGEGGGDGEVTWKDLPSEHWAEMMEVWMCHSDPSFTARLTKHTENGFWPSPGTVLVGGSYLLLHPDDVSAGQLKAGGNPFDDWQTLTCACGAVVGKQRSHNGLPGEGTVRLSKWAISLRRAEALEPITYPLSVFVVSDMLELLQAHASHHFIVASEENQERRLAMWLWSPGMGVSWRRTSAPTKPAKSPIKPSFARRESSASTKSSKSPSPTRAAGHLLRPEGSIRASKIFYHVLTNPQESITHLTGFSGKSQVEALTYPSGICDRLIAALQDSTALYPPEERMTGKYHVGFLQRGD